MNTESFYNYAIEAIVARFVENATPANYKF